MPTLRAVATLTAIALLSACADATPVAPRAVPRASLEKGGSSTVAHLCQQGGYTTLGDYRNTGDCVSSGGADDTGGGGTGGTGGGTTPGGTITSFTYTLGAGCVYTFTPVFSGGTGTLSYAGDAGSYAVGVTSRTPVYVQANAGTYTLTVTDKNGLTVSQSLTLSYCGT